VRYVTSSRGAFSIHISAWALSGAPDEMWILRVRRFLFARNSDAPYSN